MVPERRVWDVYPDSRGRVWAATSRGVACLLPGGQELCIHKPVPRRSAREWLFLLRTRRFWHRILWGR